MYLELVFYVCYFSDKLSRNKKIILSKFGSGHIKENKIFLIGSTNSKVTFASEFKYLTDLIAYTRWVF